MNEFKKLGISHLQKTYFVSSVSGECFRNSKNIERAGLFEVFKIINNSDLDFRINELKRLGYTNEY